MGGSGSGRRWHYSAKDTVEGYQSLDVRRWKRDGFLSPGRAFSWQWSRQGEVIASINVRAELGSVILTYRQRSGGDEWKDENYPVHLTTTPCHMGGERPWFLCPARGCGKRVAVLYGGGIFACRTCYRLAYPSQREDPGDRAARRAHRIRDRMGWPGGVLEGSGWGRPKGMHRRTYEALCDQHDTFEDVVNRDFIVRFGPMLKKGGF